MNGFKQRTPRPQQTALWPACLALGIAIVVFLLSVAHGWSPSSQRPEVGASPLSEAREAAAPSEPQPGAAYVRAEPAPFRERERAVQDPPRPSPPVVRDAPDAETRAGPTAGDGLASAPPVQRLHPPRPAAAGPPEWTGFDPRPFHRSHVEPSSHYAAPARAAPAVFAGSPSVLQPPPHASPQAPTQAPPEPVDALPPPPGQYQIPVFRQPAQDAVDIRMKDGRVSLVARNTPLSQVVSLLAQAQGFNVICAQDISATVSIVLRDVTWHEALSAVLSTAGYTWVHSDNIIRVTNIASGRNLAPDVQGRLLRVFALDYASGADVERAIRGLLSPAGQVFLAESSANDSRKPKDVVVVEDLPEFVARIADYVHTVDRPPRQVLIEAHVLEVKLDEDSTRGVDFKHLFSVLNNNVELQLSGMTTTLPTPPAVPTSFMARLGGGNLDAVIECLVTTHNAKTLASPRVLVVDGQEANIQVGERLPYQIKTTTETSTVQDVQFLDTGVILNVTPHIAQDGRVLMRVKPKVSTGHINTQDLPEEKTSEVHSQVLLNDGQGIIIGGLIQEKDSVEVHKIPVLGDLWLVGALFQHRSVDRLRTEIVIALVPHVQPLDGAISERDHMDLHRSRTPLLSQCLTPVDRPWEPEPLDPLSLPRFLRTPNPAEPVAGGPTWPGRPPGGHAETYLDGLPGDHGRRESYEDPPQFQPDLPVPTHPEPDRDAMLPATPPARTARAYDFQRASPVVRLPAVGAP